MTKNIIEDSDGELAMSVFINKNGHLIRTDIIKTDISGFRWYRSLTMR